MTTRHSRDELETLVATALQRAGAGAGAAEATARALVLAEIDGQSGHGLSRVESYAAQARTGKVDGAASPIITHTRPGTIMIDVAHGFFYPAANAAAAVIAKAARENGIAAAGFYRSHHAGALSLVVESYASQGLVAMMFANTPRAMTAWGGTKALFGTNPIAFAAPVPDNAPIIIDMALSEVARGKILKASQEGKPIPQGWAKDTHGQPTTDATAALNGTLEPIGGAKGAALALMVEILAAALTGANLSSEASSFFDGKGAAPGVGQFLIVIDPEAFGGAQASAKMSVIASAIAGDDGARLPGSTRAMKRAEADRDGIAVAPSLLARLQDLAGA